MMRTRETAIEMTAKTAQIMRPRWWKVMPPSQRSTSVTVATSPSQRVHPHRRRRRETQNRRDSRVHTYLIFQSGITHRPAHPGSSAQAWGWTVESRSRRWPQTQYLIRTGTERASLTKRKTAGHRCDTRSLQSRHASNEQKRQVPISRTRSVNHPRRPAGGDKGHRDLSALKGLWAPLGSSLQQHYRTGTGPSSCRCFTAALATTDRRAVRTTALPGFTSLASFHASCGGARGSPPSPPPSHDRSVAFSPSWRRRSQALPTARQRAACVSPAARGGDPGWTCRTSIPSSLGTESRKLARLGRPDRQWYY